MKVTLQARRLEVKLQARTWDQAWDVISRNKRTPPDGYKLASSVIENRSKSGSRANFVMTFFHVDRRVDPFSHAEACIFFEGDKAAANGARPSS